VSIQGAVFLSYASQDAEAAKRICEALRGAGIEVWFDQSQLRGGDAWDQSIRKQIKECALFMPVISENTNTRLEGYFRREWKQAVERTHDMDDDLPFLMPVVIDGTFDAGARVPEKFRQKQWTRLPGGETPAAFCERVKKLLGGPVTDTAQQSPAQGGPMPVLRPVRRSRWWLIPAIISVIACAVLDLWQPWHKAEKAVAAVPKAPTVSPTPPLSEARQLAQRAGAIWADITELSADKMGAAEELYTRALTLDPTDAEIWAANARLDAWMVFMNFDSSDARGQKAQKEAARAATLAPDSRAARQAQACVLGFANGSNAQLGEAEKIYRALLLENPEDRSVIREFVIVLRDERHFDEAEALCERHGLLEDNGWNFFAAGKYDEANRIADRLLAQKRTLGALGLKWSVEYVGFEDLAAARAATSQLTQTELLSDDPAFAAATYALFSREPDEAIRLLNALPHEFVATFTYNGPKRLYTGIANEMAGRTEAARAEWRIALQQVQERLKTISSDGGLLYLEAWLLACLGDSEEAERLLRLVHSQLEPYLHQAGADNPDLYYLNTDAAILLRLGRKEEVLGKLSSVLRAKPKHWEILHRYARFDPFWDPLRGDPRFEKLLRDTLPPGRKPFDEPAAKAVPAPESGR
jgi:tetratricopeptide (TPR) repeat protein